MQGSLQCASQRQERDAPVEMTVLVGGEADSSAALRNDSQKSSGKRKGKRNCNCKYRDPSLRSRMTASVDAHSESWELELDVEAGARCRGSELRARSSGLEASAGGAW